MRFALKPSGLTVLAILSFGAVTVRAADATTPIDYTQRNAPFAPAGSVAPQKQTPATNDTLQEKRVEKTVVDKQTAPLADRRAAVDVKETREKQVREKNSHRPETIEQPTSAFNHRLAAISTNADTRKPPTVAKYQDSLTAANAIKTAPLPALDRATSATINRFVFRKNPSEQSAVTNGTPVIPAAGGSTFQK